MGREIITTMWYNSPTYILNEDTQSVIRAIGVSHTACKDEFRRKVFDLTAGVYFYFYNMYTSKYVFVYILVENRRKNGIYVVYVFIYWSKIAGKMIYRLYMYLYIYWSKIAGKIIYIDYICI